MGTRVYKDSEGNFRRNNDIFPKGNYRLVYNSDQTKAGIFGKDNYYPFIDMQLIEDFEDELGTPYADASALELALSGIISSSVFDMLNDNNFALKVQLGQIRGVYAVSKFGENQEISTNTDPEDVWDFGGLYNFSTSAIIDSISSSSGSDNVAITIEGLDSDWNAAVQTITLTGQTRVPLTTNLIRVYRAFNANGINLTGSVYVYENTALSLGVPIDTSKIRAQIKAVSNQTEMMIYSVPAGKTAVYLEGFVSISRGGGVSANADMTFKTREFEKVFRVRRRISINSQGGAWRAVYSIPTILNAKSDIIFRCELVSATLGVSGGFQALIFDNEIWGL